MPACHPSYKVPSSLTKPTCVKLYIRGEREECISYTLTVGLSGAIFQDPSESSVGLLNVLVTNSGAVLKCFAASNVATEERDGIKMLVLVTTHKSKAIVPSSAESTKMVCVFGGEISLSSFSKWRLACSFSIFC